MKDKYLHFFLTLFLFAYCSCKKDTAESELKKLPPITQEGKRTFGCLVNGKAWMPDSEDWYIATPPLRFYYENYKGGQFAISAKLRIGNLDQSINLGIDSCTSSKIYIYSTFNLSHRIAFNNYQLSACTTYFSSDNDINTTGHVNITRFDLQNGIISGTFEFTLSKTGCETISITNGRFDAKL